MSGARPRRAAPRVAAALGVVLHGSVFLGAGCQLPDLPGPELPPVRRGAVACEHPLATAVGLDVLARGGNAADAAVATALALAVVYPKAGNLGGGGFALCAGQGDEPLALDFREVAPASTRAEAYLDPSGAFVPRRSIAGPLAVGVPGSPAGLHELFLKCGSGRLSWAELVAPAVRLAEEGFAVDPWLAEDLASERYRDRMNAAAEALFYPGGEALAAGEPLVQAELARTLRRYAAEGPSGFYSGEVAQRITEALAREPVEGLGRVEAGFVDEEDLAAYAPVWRAPLIGHFGGREVVTMPPPSSGGIVILQALAILDGLPLSGELARYRDPHSGGRPGELLTHWWIEILRRSFADRAQHLGDPDFHPIPVEELISSEWILARRVSIGERADLEVGAWVAPTRPESRETTHLSVLDTEGNAVSMTTTLNGAFGSGILVEGAGFLLNNELDDFAIQAGAPNQYQLVGSRANAIEPGKRPLSSMSPTIVRDAGGSVRLVVGSPGGPRIITAVFQVLVRILLLGEDPYRAVRANRLHQQWSPRATRFEARQGGGPDPALLEALAVRGHPLEVVEKAFASVQAILVGEDGEPVAVSDPRRGGAAGVVGRGVQAPALPRSGSPAPPPP